MKRNTISRLLLMMLVVIMSLSARAIPAYNALQRVQQPDGTWLSFRLVGDEHSHSFVTADDILLVRSAEGTMEYAHVDADGITVSTGIMAHDVSLRDDRERAVAQPLDSDTRYRLLKRAEVKRGNTVASTATSTFPTRGEMPGLVLMVEFADNSFQEEYSRDIFQRAMTEEGWNSYGATGSVRDYYIDQSSGVFVPNFEVYGPIKLPRTMRHYGANNSQGNDAHPTEMVTTACQIAHDSLGVDFSRYDYDGDGNVDFVYIFYAGYAESYGASTNTIWPHASNLITTGNSITLDGKQLSRYACSSELKYVSGTTFEGIGTFCHEFAHVLGLPDMYNTYSTSDIQLGSWDLLDQGAYNNYSHTPPSLSAYERSFLGWLELTELTEPSDRVELPEMTENNFAYRISTKNPDEFFTLENRQQRGWDSAQPGKGLMIIHVTYLANAWAMNAVNSGTIKRYDLVEADGTQNGGQQSDLYPTATNDLFTDYSSPSALSVDGTATEKPVSSIRDEDGLITFRFMRDRVSTPVALDATDVSDRAFTAQWTAVDDALSYRLTVDEILPAEENPLISSDDFSTMTLGKYPTSDYVDISENLDSYFSLSGWTGTALYECGGYLRIGGYGQDGFLFSPALSCSSADGITVAFHCRAYTAKRVSYTVTVTNLSTGISEEQTLQTDRTETEQILHFSTSGTFRLDINTDKERLFLNDLRILRGTLEGDIVWTAGPHQWVIDGIDDTSYRVEGLLPSHAYTYYVQGCDDEVSRTSLASNVITVETSIDTSISDIFLPDSTVYYNLQGMRVSDSSRGILLRRTTSPQGKPTVVKVVKGE